MCERETGYEGGGGLQVPWWGQKAVEEQMRVTVEAISAEARMRRRHKSGMCDESKGRSEGGYTDSKE